MHNARRRFCSRVLPILLLFAATGLQASTISTTDLSEFLSKLQPGYQIQTFDSLPANTVGNTTSSPINFTSGIFTYSASVGGAGFFNGDIGAGDIVLSTAYDCRPITFTFTSGNVTAVGGYFWNTDDVFGVSPGTISVTLDDGATLSDPSAGPGTFFGFYSDRPIESLSVTPPSAPSGSFIYAAVNNLHLGQTGAVPEPATVAGALGGLLALIALRRRLRS